jgi:hypothetical protein
MSGPPGASRVCGLRMEQESAGAPCPPDARADTEPVKRLNLLPSALIAETQPVTERLRGRSARFSGQGGFMLTPAHDLTAYGGIPRLAARATSSVS